MHLPKHQSPLHNMLHLSNLGSQTCIQQQPNTFFLSPPFCAIHFVGDCTLSLKCIHMSELQVCDSIPATHISRHINSITQVRQLILVNLLLHIKPGLSTTVNNGLYILSYCLESSSYLDVKKCTCHQLQPFQNSCVHSFYGIS